ncbi:hypothetical protein L21SP3_00376 [Sedimentisphaera cyanobacteriorum]|uniref:Lipoprotein n=1 Tax=Sedimentisphaera cyanobacteriorum TaxID=1940790 RepID=A0A1Q2HM12_9BACT|nr:hypothetical protein L21SP3_00376 [Sedimentisphaera cyanobacteriorum]
MKYSILMMLLAGLFLLPSCHKKPSYLITDNITEIEKFYVLFYHETHEGVMVLIYYPQMARMSQILFGLYHKKTIFYWN